MKKSELKNIIKECVKEVIFEEGVLSGIITEVAQGLQGSAILQEARPQRQAAPLPSPVRKIEDAKRKRLAAIGGDAYADIKKRFSTPEAFEGTQPLRESTGKGALSGVDPRDPGIDLSQIPGMSNWAAVAVGKK